MTTTEQRLQRLEEVVIHGSMPAAQALGISVLHDNTQKLLEGLAELTGGVGELDTRVGRVEDAVTRIEAQLTEVLRRLPG